MLLACNYSRPLLELLSAGAVEVEYIKLSRADMLEEEMKVARPLRPVLLHTLDRVGEIAASVDEPAWQRANSHLKRAGSPHVAMHLVLQRDDWDAPVDLQQQSPEVRRRMRECIRDTVRLACAALDVPLLLENAPYYGSRGTVHAVTDPLYVCDLLTTTDTGLLLDLAHIRVAAYYLSVDPREYVKQMPLERVREIHVSGPGRNERGEFHDRHDEMSGTDWSLLEFVLERTGPQVITLEYGGTGPKVETSGRNSSAALERQLLRLRRLIS